MDAWVWRIRVMGRSNEALIDSSKVIDNGIDLYIFD